MLYMVVVANKKSARKTLYVEASGPMVFDTPQLAFAHMRDVFGDNPELSFILVSLTVQS